MAHIKRYPKLMCMRCRVKKATCEVINDRSTSIGDFCTRCGMIELNKFIARRNQ